MKFLIFMNLILSSCTVISKESLSLFPVLDQNEKWGYIDVNGNMAIEPQFIQARYFHEGLAVVQIGEDGKESPWGAIDTEGNFVIQAQFTELANFSDSLARAYIRQDESNIHETTSGYINKKGEFVIPWDLQGHLKFVLAGDFSEGFALVHPPVNLTDFSSIVNHDAKTMEWIKSWSRLKEKERVITEDNPIGYINKKGALAIPNAYYKASAFTDGVSSVNPFPRDDDVKGYIDQSGKYLIEPQYDIAFDFLNGVAIVKKEDLYMIINKKNDVVAVLSQYNFISPFSDGLASVEKDDKRGFINVKGELVIDIKYDLVGEFSDGVAAVAIIDGERHDQAWLNRYKWGYINKKGEQIIPFQYKKRSVFINGLALVEVETDDRDGSNYGYINKKGDWVYGPVVGRWIGMYE